MSLAKTQTVQIKAEKSACDDDFDLSREVFLFSDGISFKHLKSSFPFPPLCFRIGSACFQALLESPRLCLALRIHCASPRARASLKQISALVALAASQRQACSSTSNLHTSKKLDVNRIHEKIRFCGTISRTPLGHEAPQWRTCSICLVCR